MLETTTAPVRFRAEVERIGRNTIAVEVPAGSVALLRGGPRPKVAATIDGRTFRTSIGRSGDRYLVSLRAESRQAGALIPGDVVDVAVALDTFARMVAASPRPRPASRGIGARPAQRYRTGP